MCVSNSITNATPKCKQQNRWGCYFYINGFPIQLGFHISFKERNVEIHLPFGFLRIGNCLGSEKKGFFGRDIGPWAIKMGYKYKYTSFGWVSNKIS